MQPLRARAYQPLRELHHAVVVCERFVHFERREFWIVPRAGALVAEDAPDLEHALEAGNEQPLEVQLGGDAQREGALERVMVGLERPCVRTAGHRLQHLRTCFVSCRTVSSRCATSLTKGIVLCVLHKSPNVRSFIA